MELEDFEPANEFEFDLSDVDVAAFESVATEDTSATTNAAQQQQQQQQLQTQQQEQEQQHQQQQQHDQQQEHHPELLHQEHHEQQGDQEQQQLHTLSAIKTTTLHQLVSSTQQQQLPPPPLPPPQQQQQQQQQQQSPTIKPAQPQQIQLQPHHLAQISSAISGTPGKILLVRIQPGTPGFKNLSLVSNCSLTTANGNQRHQIKHLAPQQAFSSSNAVTSSSSTSHYPPSKNLSFSDSLRAPTPNSTLVPNEVPKRKPCNCTKSQCLKLYCDCFANGEFCSGCNCTNCFNSLEKEKERQKAISVCLERNPEAFRPKIGKAVKMSIGEPAPDSIERRHTKGCNCKRSGCLKNYCECYEAKILCSNLCKCCGCKNYEDSFERKSLMQLANSASEHARGILKNLLPTINNSNTGKEFTKSFITDKVIRASMVCLLQSAQKAEEEGISASNIPNLIQIEMGKCLRMIVDSATESSSPKKR